LHYFYSKIAEIEERGRRIIQPSCLLQLRLFDHELSALSCLGLTDKALRSASALWV